MCRVRVTRARFKLIFRIPWMDAPRMCGVDGPLVTQYDELTEQRAVLKRNRRLCLRRCTTSTHYTQRHAKVSSVSHSPHTVFTTRQRWKRGEILSFPDTLTTQGLSLWCRFNIIVGGEILSF